MTFQEDTCVTLWPKWKAKEGKEEDFLKSLPPFVDRVRQNEQGSCLFYAWVGPSEDGYVYCREGYKDAQGILQHLENVDACLKQALELADVVSVEVHGPAEELKKLQEPLASFNPNFFPLQEGGLRAEAVHSSLPN
jgi:quinol monooxygenase YgiN